MYDLPELAGAQLSTRGYEKTNPDWVQTQGRARATHEIFGVITALVGRGKGKCGHKSCILVAGGAEGLDQGALHSPPSGQITDRGPAGLTFTTLCQCSPNYSPGAKSGSPKHFIQPAAI